MNLAKRARILVLAAAMALPVAPLPAVAQDVSDSHLRAARAAISAIAATDQYDAVLPQAAHGLKSDLIQQSPNLVSLINETVDEVAIDLAARRADLENEAALAYARVFSEEELNEITTFYNSPAGQKLLENGAEVAREVDQAAEIWRRGIVRDLHTEVTRKLEAAMGEEAAGDGQ